MKKAYQTIVLLLMSGFMMFTVSSTVSYDVEAVEFYSNETKLAGSVAFPEGPVQAAVVFVHGSGRQRRNLELARRFASEGIAVLVYDKRGVGQSEGTYVQSDGSISETDLQLLSDDVAAAIEVLHKYDRLQEVPIGLTGFSQAGWVIPQAAEKSQKVEFMTLWSGPVCKFSEEDIFSKYTSDRDFRGVPSYQQVLEMRKDPYEWPTDQLGKDIDSSEILANLDIPGFWIFGGMDGSIPVDLSISNLTQLASEGHDTYEYALFSNAGHATLDQTFLTMTAWIKRIETTDTVSDKNSRDLDKFVGIYRAMDPPIEVTITRQDTTLIATLNEESLEFKYTGGHSFRAHDYGNGYIFLDFFPEEGRMNASESGKTYMLYK